MAARAIWKGIIRFGSVEVPVKMYSALEDRSIHFRLLHRPDLSPVNQRMVDPRTGEPVPFHTIRRGYQTDEGEIILLENEELETLIPEHSRDIEVTRFVGPGVISHQWYDRPYVLGPDGETESFHALTEALDKSGKEGVARWTMRKKAYIGALRAGNRSLMLITLFHAEEVVGASALPRPEGRPLEELELRMAEQLVSALEGEFDPASYRDEYRERVLELIQAKDRGTAVAFRRREERPPEPMPLSELLKRSVERVREEREVA
jgi:DNA end-binding protein Ku